jgi:hypothetical protein
MSVNISCIDFESLQSVLRVMRVIEEGKGDCVKPLVTSERTLSTLQDWR